MNVTGARLTIDVGDEQVVIEGSWDAVWAVINSCRFALEVKAVREGISRKS